jgi:hypothetical protein
MALEKSEVNDKLEIVDVGSWKVLQVRTAMIIKDDGKEISRTFHRRVINPGDDWSSENAEIKTICDMIMTAERINACKAAQEAGPETE